MASRRVFYSIDALQGGAYVQSSMAYIVVA